MSAPVDEGWVEPMQRALLDRPKNMRLRYVNGAFLAVPVRSAHFTNGFVLNLWARSIPSVKGAGEFSLKTAIDGYAPEPDFALVRESAYAPDRAEYLHDEVLFIAEVVSTESEQRDYVRKHNHYAMADIPAYLVVDVLTAEWTLFTEPREGAYTLTTTGNFGAPIPVEVAGQPHPIDSGEFEHL
jgi:Uma2 family endonuclease